MQLKILFHALSLVSASSNYSTCKTCVNGNCTWCRQDGIFQIEYSSQCTCAQNEFAAFGEFGECEEVSFGADPINNLLDCSEVLYTTCDSCVNAGCDWCRKNGEFGQSERSGCNCGTFDEFFHSCNDISFGSNEVTNITDCSPNNHTDHNNHIGHNNQTNNNNRAGNNHTDSNYSNPYFSSPSHHQFESTLPSSSSNKENRSMFYPILMLCLVTSVVAVVLKTKNGRLNLSSRLDHGASNDGYVPVNEVYTKPQHYGSTS
mmetsp:Transcript_14070/g.16190  ORF Transcript_14070/g.16190 Transcript_14070/m.16190 type:complete len:260 (+) Transcript_14070:117-896(+)